MPSSFNPSLLYIGVVKRKKVATRWCGGNSESKQTLHSYPSSALTRYVTLGLSEPFSSY